MKYNKKYFAAKITPLCLLISLCLIIFKSANPVFADEESGFNPFVRVGLLFGQDVVESFLVKADGGFMMGYTEDLKFNGVVRTQYAELYIAQDENLAKNAAGRYYYSNSNIVKGKYHAQFSNEFADINGALNFISSLDASNYPDAFPAYINGAIYVRCGDFQTQGAAQNFVSQKSGLICSPENPGAVTIISPGDNKIVFEFCMDGGEVAVEGYSADGVPAPILTSAQNTYPYYMVFPRVKNGLQVLNMLPMQEYIKGVVSVEIPTSWSEESLKAFAAVARTFAVGAGDRHTSDSFNLCGDTHCQAYRGYKYVNDAVKNAVDATAGQVITYDGKPIEAYYHSSAGGITENHNEAWGGVFNRPYLASVSLPFEKYANPDYKNALWRFEVDFPTLTTYLKTSSAYKDTFSEKLKGSVVSVKVTSRSESGYVKSVEVADNLGNTVEIKNSDSVRIAFSRYANSANMNIHVGFSNYVNEFGSIGFDLKNMYTLTADGQKLNSNSNSVNILSANGERTVTVDGSMLVFEGKGWGHGVGLSQYGVKDLGDMGVPYTEIIKTFYTGVQIEPMTNIVK